MPARFALKLSRCGVGVNIPLNFQECPGPGRVVTGLRTVHDMTGHMVLLSGFMPPFYHLRGPIARLQLDAAVAQAVP
jgi:hypothetical protein